MCMQRVVHVIATCGTNEDVLPTQCKISSHVNASDAQNDSTIKHSLGISRFHHSLTASHLGTNSLLKNEPRPLGSGIGCSQFSKKTLPNGRGSMLNILFQPAARPTGNKSQMIVSYCSSHPLAQKCWRHIATRRSPILHHSRSCGSTGLLRCRSFPACLYRRRSRPGW